MALPLERLGMMHTGHRAVIDAARAGAYAAATNDDRPEYTAGACVPPLFGAVATWEPLTRVVTGVVPRAAARRLVHGEQDMHFHRTLVPGQVITTSGRVHSVRAGQNFTRLTVQLSSVDASDGRPVLTQYVTLLGPGMEGAVDHGPDKPSHAFSPEVSPVVATARFHVDDDQTFRYRDASGDDMPIHVDEDYARSVGLPGLVVHGLCTMAMAGRVVVDAVAGRDPRRLRRLAVRFSGAVLPGDDVTVRIHAAGPGGGATGDDGEDRFCQQEVALEGRFPLTEAECEDSRRRFHFEAHADRGARVLCNGLAEVS